MNVHKMIPKRHGTILVKGFFYVLLVLSLISHSQFISAEHDSDDISHHGNPGGGVHLNLKEGAVMGNYEAGQTQVMNIQRDSHHPKYGTCWVSALQTVAAGCKRLTDDEQSRMALTLANCHLAKAGFDTYNCDETMDIKDCLNPMKGDSISFNAYTEFFTHTQDICFFLQSQVWHEQTEETVEKLTQSSEDVAIQLEVTGKLQENMIKQQNESLKNQKEILAQEAKLNEALKSSTNSIQEVFAEMKSSTLEQKALFAETFDRVAQVQRLMLGEFTWFNSVIYYVVGVLLVYMVTSTSQTASARFSLFLLLLVNWVVEWVMFRIMDSSDQTVFHANSWWCRKIFCSLGLLLLIYKASQYKDYNKINHAILLQIQTHIQQQRLSASSNSLTVAKGLIQSVVQSSSSAAMSIASPIQVPAIKDRRGQTLRSGSNSRHDITGFSSDSDADITFNPENLASSESHYSSSDQSFMTAETGSKKPSMMDYQVSKTPLRAHLPSTSQGSQADDPGSSAKRKRGRPKGSRSKTSREGTPMHNLSFQSPYNLRQRGLHQSPNPVVDLETTLMFAQHVESLASRHYVIQRKSTSSLDDSRNRKNKSPAKSRKGPAFFSSDEEP
nr:uncharacterized protein LOC129257712 [Lytechinus pictus]